MGMEALKMLGLDVKVLFGVSDFNRSNLAL